MNTATASATCATIRQLLALILLFALTAMACSDDNEQPTSIDLSAYDASTYFEVLQGDTTFPEIEIAPIEDEETWRSLVAQQRGDGLASLPPEQRKQLLLGAMKAYLILVERAQFSYAMADASAIATEVYTKEEGFFIAPLKRHGVYHGLEVQFGGLPIPAYPAAPDEEIFVLDTALRDFPFGRIWTTADGGTTCFELSSEIDNNGFARLAYRGRLLISIAGGKANGSASFRRSELEEITIHDPEAGFEATYWLDVTSLWPVKWQETSTGDPDGRGPITATLETTLVAVNGDLDVVPPTSCDTDESTPQP